MLIVAIFVRASGEAMRASDARAVEARHVGNGSARLGNGCVGNGSRNATAPDSRPSDNLNHRSMTGFWYERGVGW